MAHNTRPILVDVNGKPIPQYFDPLADEYKPLLGQHGAARSILYGPDGQPITNENPLEVRVRQLETLLGALNAAKETNPDAASATLLALIRGLMSAAAKETTLEAIKSTDGIKKIADAVTVSGLENLATETKLEAVRTLVEDLKSELNLVKSELATIKANQTSGDQKVQLSGTFTEDILSKVDLSNSLLALISHGQTKAVLNSWQQVQHIVRAGLHHQVFQIGDQFVATFNGQPVVWDVIGIDHDKPTDPRFTHSLTIQSHDCLLVAQFSARQALYYAEAPLPAGEHRFTLNDVQYSFTTSQVVPAGGQVFISGWESDSASNYVPTTIATYAADRTTTIETDLVVTQSTGADTLSPVNHHHRCKYGSNNYVESAIRQWLNSEAQAFTWVPKTNYDRPSTYSGGGFLHQLDPELVAVLGAVDKQVARNTVTDGGGQDLFSDKVFLLSGIEIYGMSGGGIEAPYPYYESLAPSPTTGALDGRIKYLGSSAYRWWLRSPLSSGATALFTVHPSGNVSSNTASDRHGVAPAVVIV